MTHSLHRIGTEDALTTDYVFLAMLAAGINDQTSYARQKLLQIGELLDHYGPKNSMAEEFRPFSPVITAVYDNIVNVKNVLQALKQKDLGISIVVSGLISEIQKIVEELGLKMHTVHLSLGVFGKKTGVPSDVILEITSMCGHHCVSSQSIERYGEQIKNGHITSENATSMLMKPCICGIVNPTRVNSILQDFKHQQALKK